MDKSSSEEKIKYPNRWRKGTSGNPKGRPKVDFKIRELAKVHTEDAIRKLVEIDTGSDYSSNLQFCAAVAILNVAWHINLMRHYLPGLKMTVWQYYLLPELIALPEKKIPNKPPQSAIINSVMRINSI